MSNANEFIEIHIQVEKALQAIVQDDRRKSFSELVRLAAIKNKAVKSYQAKLRDFNDLRNAIVHHRDSSHMIIAEPTSEALAEFRKIADAILKPKPVTDLFSKEPVVLFTPQDKLASVLRYMRDKDFSQVVIRDDNRLSLLTTEGIARWLEQKAIEDVISIQDATVADAHACDPVDCFFLMSHDKTVYDAQAAFAQAIDQGYLRLFAIIVTQNGKATETPLGVVTPWDVLGNRF